MNAAPEAGTDGHHSGAASPAARRQIGAAAPAGWRLRLLVFVVGAASLGAEIAAARLLAPYFGASTIVWANTIATVLVSRCRSATGSAGGSPTATRRCAGCAGWCSPPAAARAVPFAARPFLDISVGALDSISAGAFVGSLAAVMVLVAAPVLLLGAVSPYAVRLAVRRVEESGAVTGAPLRDLDRRLACRHVRRRAGADPVRRHAADVPGLRAGARARRGADPARARVGRPG